MGQLLLVLVVAVIVAAVALGVTVLVTGRDPGLVPAEPDGQAQPLPGDRPLREADIPALRFDTATRGYRMAQVDQALRRVAYDIGYKTELIGVLEAEVAALREGRVTDADQLRRARESAGGSGSGEPDAVPAPDRAGASGEPDDPATADAEPAVAEPADPLHDLREDPLRDLRGPGSR